MKTYRIFGIVLLLSCLNNQAQTASQAQASAPTQQPSFARAIKNAIAFISTNCAADPMAYEGTGFFVSMSDPHLPQGYGFGYLVTNRHVAQPNIEKGTPCSVTKQTIRVNTKAAGADGGRNAIFNNNSKWVFPLDDSVDLAILPFFPDPRTFDVAAIPVEMLATSAEIERNQISEGDSVLYAGFFYQFPGRFHLEPIIRQGIIAMMPDEPLITTLGKPGMAYLADAHVFGGNSGSPIFVNTSGLRNGGLLMGQQYLLLGVIAGLETEDTDFSVQPVTTYTGKMGANSGVSFVVPAIQLATFLNEPELKARREDVIASGLKKSN